MRTPRDLHPVAWWCWAIGLAIGASSTTNPWLLAMIIAVASITALSCRGDQPWSRSFRLYVWLAVAVVVIRVVVRMILGGNDTGHVLIALPEIPLPDWAAGISLLGTFSREELLAATYEGLRLAALLLAVGAANTLANPKRLMKSLPPALYEVGTAMVVAISVLPQLADSARRVHAAQLLRGRPAGRFGRFRGVRRVLVPVLEDAFERSLALAAGMDARGYGRSGVATASQRRVTGTLMILGLLGVCVGVYGVLDDTAPQILALPMVMLGLGLAGVGFVSAGRRVQRSRYRPDRWRWPEIGVAGSGLLAGIGLAGIQRWDMVVAHPGVTEMPTVTLPTLIVLCGVAPVWLAPPPLRLSGPSAVTAAPRLEGAQA